MLRRLNDMPYPPRPIRLLWLGLAWTGLSWTGFSLHADRARAEEVEPAVRAAIILRSLAYESSIRRGEGSVRVAVVGGSARGSDDDAESVQEAFESLASRIEIANRPIRIRRFELANNGDPPSALSEWAPHVVYLSHGIHSSAADVTATRRVVVCASGDVVGRGCILAVEADEDASRIVIDLPRARRLQLAFDSRLLALSRLIED